MADIDKVKRGDGPREAQSKVPDIGQIPTQRLGQTAKVGNHLCHDLDVVCEVATVRSNGILKGQCGLLATFDTLPNPLITKLGAAVVSNGSV